MSIDDRLKRLHDWDLAHMPTADAELLDVIVGRVTRRRRIRTGAAGIAVAALLIAIAAPWAFSHSELDGRPVERPNHSEWAPEVISASPLDGHWEGSSGTRAERLAALEETGLERHGDAVYTEYLAHAMTDLNLGDGVVSLSTSEMRGRSFLGARSHRISLHGEFTVRADTVAMRFDEVPGTTVFRWSRLDDGAGERLELTFISTTAGRMNGVPAEVFLRLWSAQPLWLSGCC